MWLPEKRTQLVLPEGYSTRLSFVDPSDKPRIFTIGDAVKAVQEDGYAIADEIDHMWVLSNERDQTLRAFYEEVEDQGNVRFLFPENRIKGLAFAIKSYAGGFIQSSNIRYGYEWQPHGRIVVRQKE